MAMKYLGPCRDCKANPRLPTGPICEACELKRNEKKELRRQKTVEYMLMYKYGLTSAEVDEMAKRQEAKCAICKELKPLVVDHSHVTGKVRELLCHRCNLLIGHLERSKDLLNDAFTYLVNHSL